MKHETDMQGNHVLTFTPREFEELLEAVDATGTLVVDDLTSLIEVAKGDLGLSDIYDDSWDDSWGSE